jgi:hypothetical protein
VSASARISFRISRRRFLDLALIAPRYSSKLSGSLVNQRNESLPVGDSRNFHPTLRVATARPQGLLRRVRECRTHLPVERLHKRLQQFPTAAFNVDPIRWHHRTGKPNKRLSPTAYDLIPSQKTVALTPSACTENTMNRRPPSKASAQFYVIGEEFGFKFFSRSNPMRSWPSHQGCL